MNTEQQQDAEHPAFARISIRTALIVVALAAVSFASYRLGVERGRSIGPVVPTNISATNIYTREYDVSDLVKVDGDAELIVTAIRKTVDIDNWDTAGGYAELQHDPASHTLVVSHVWPGHIELVKFLESVREFSTYGGGLEETLRNAESNF